MLLTTCPKCSAKFKVQPDQLNVRQGRVMCGRCRNVFNAFESLQRQPDDDTAGRRADEIAAALSEPPEVSVGFSKMEPDVPQELMDVAHPLEETEESRLKSLPFAGEQAPSELSISAMQPEYVTDQVVDTTSKKNPLLAASAPYRGKQPKSTRPWAFGIVFLLLVGMLQAAFYFRTAAVIQGYPQLRNAFVAACEIAGCSVPWGRDETAFKIPWSDLVEPPGRPGRILLTAAIANRSATRQDLPALELRLTDNGDQVLISRVLMPADYLGHAVGKGESIAPGGEMVISMTLDVSSKSAASGYALRPFFP